MSTGSFDAWTGNILDIGPIYPFVGAEGVLVIIGVVLWIGWHIWQLKFESDVYRAEVEKDKGEVLAKAIRGEEE